MKHALIILILGWLLAISLAAQPSSWILTNVTISATEQEAQEGYFHIGPGLMIVTEPESDAHKWFREHLHQRYSISFRKDE
jgi:hypothetical protein